MPAEEGGRAALALSPRVWAVDLDGASVLLTLRLLDAEAQNMHDDFNPYAAPATTTMHPRAAEWLHSTDDPSLQKVAQGLGLIFTSILVFVGTIVLVFILGIVMGVMIADPGVRAGPGAAAVPEQTIETVVLAGMIIGYGLSLIGSFMCLATPEETGAKGLITASVVLMVISLFLFVVNYFAQQQGLKGFANLLSLIGGICFIVFLKRLAQFIGAFHLAQRARNILIALVVGVALLILAGVLAFAGALNAAQGAGGGGMVALAVVIGLVLFIGGLIVLVMYANLINNLRKAIQSGGAIYS